MKREDCLRWLSENYPDRVVPRSACIGCPFHNDAEWRRMKSEDALSFSDACEFDAAIRSCGGMRGQMFLHRSCKPLRDVDFRTLEQKGQLNMFNQECEGMCGV
jgi:hypothetical protein